MASEEHGLGRFDPKQLPDASPFQFGVVVSNYNNTITDVLLDGCLKTLRDKGAKGIEVIHVPGSFELVSGALNLLESGKRDAVICLGCVIKGETDHDRYINQAVAQGITDLSIQYKTPVLFGVLTTNTREQAEARAGGEFGNKGTEAAQAAIFMAALKNR